jgi:hypothetical protein
MKVLLLTIPLVLFGCSAVPVKTPFPTVPDILMRPPIALIEAKESESLSDFLVTVTDNYAIANSNSNRLIAWQNWYTTQKNIWSK